MSPRFENGLPGCVGTSCEDRMQNFHVPSRCAIIAICITSLFLGIILARVLLLCHSGKTSETAKFFPAWFLVRLQSDRLRHELTVQMLVCCLNSQQPSLAMSSEVDRLLEVTVYLPPNGIAAVQWKFFCSGLAAASITSAFPPCSMLWQPRLSRGYSIFGRTISRASARLPVTPRLCRSDSMRRRHGTNQWPSHCRSAAAHIPAGCRLHDE